MIATTLPRIKHMTIGAVSLFLVVLAAAGQLALGAQCQNAACNANANITLEAALAQGITALSQWYGTNGVFTTTGWWNSANDLTTLCNAARMALKGKSKHANFTSFVNPQAVLQMLQHTMYVY